MHNKHAEEAIKPTAARTFTTTLAVALEKNKVCLPSMFYEAVERSANKLVRSAVQKEREEFAEAVKKQIRREIPRVPYKMSATEIHRVISRIQSDREKGE